MFSLASICTYFQLGVCLLSLRCCDRPVKFAIPFSLLTSSWSSLILSSIAVPVSPKNFLQQEKVAFYTTAHALPVLKGFVSNFELSDNDLVTIPSKSYLLATCLSCSDIPF